MENQGDSDSNVRVAVRCRPFSSTEKSNGEVSCVTILKDKVVIVNPNNPGEEQSFAFDLIFDQNSLQSSVWDTIGAPILSKAFDGYNGTIFAYGQTGSGKTWSMQGAADGGDLQGIIPRLNTALFERINKEKLSRPSVQFLVTASYFEIYNEFIFDLLDATDRKKKPAASKGGLEIKEHPVLGVYVKGLQEYVVENSAKLQKIIEQGMGSRTVASTQMNSESSRSHSIFVITVRQKDLDDETQNVFAKVNLVDLAGSERVKSTGASGATLKEGTNINKSLSELGNVINALVAQAKGKKGVFVPYRNSKLTRVLQESLGGNSITAMLAALSPAGSFFDETLSTLKYANRAKAIKVNAVKNEEASQVSKLNDEIKQLKEKLQGQTSNVDTTLLEERHRQQLLDLEEAIKSTWEAKSKVSDEHEKERKRLELEQRAAAQALEANRKRNWRLLEEKGDLDLSLSHIKEISSSDARMTQYLVEWGAALKGIQLQEQSMVEHHTVVQVYRAALEKDKAELIKSQNPGSTVSPRSSSSSLAPYDKATLSLWRQFNDKVQAIRTEVENWTNLQDVVVGSINSLSLAVCCAVNEKKKSYTLSAPSDDAAETLQGLQMLSRQIEGKLSKCHQNLEESRKKIANFTVMGGELVLTLNKYEKVILDYIKEEESSAKFSPRGQKPGVAGRGNSDVRAVELGKLVERMKECTRQLTSVSLDEQAKEKKGTDLGPENPESLGDILCDYSVDYLYGKVQQAVGKGVAKELRSVGDDKGNVMADRDICWAVGQGDMSSNITAQKEEELYIQLDIREVFDVTAVILQGGYTSAVSDISALTLPCGVNLLNCNGDVASTAAAMGDVISWPALLKKTPPEKFLNRPPVRFLFDLFVFCGIEFPDLLPQALGGAEWGIVGESKVAKLEFMNVMLTFLSVYLDIASPTTAASIISGLNSELTNTVLQHLAIAIYRHKTSAASGGEGTLSRPVGVGAGTGTGPKVVPSWPVKVGVSLSADGSIWRPREFLTGKPFTVPLSDAEGKVEVQLNISDGTARYIRVFPLEWSSENGVSAVGGVWKSGYAMRISVRARPVREGGSDPASKGVVPVLAALQDMTMVIIAAIAVLSEAEQRMKFRKQEEIRKQMESLANEKMTLELKLANEKRDAVNEKENLADQLRNALEEQHKAQSMYEQERAMKSQLEIERSMAEEEKMALQAGLQDQLDQTSALKNELLKFQATHEKHRMLIETLRLQLEEEEKSIAELTLQRNEAKALREQWDGEKEDFACQISVLTEERDTAQSSEELLYERLGERTQDLEILQESYVDMTDRCNDANDEISELREQVHSYQSSLKERNAVLTMPYSQSSSVLATSDCLPTSGKGQGQGVKVSKSESADDGDEKKKGKEKRKKSSELLVLLQDSNTSCSGQEVGTHLPSPPSASRGADSKVQKDEASDARHPIESNNADVEAKTCTKASRDNRSEGGQGEYGEDFDYDDEFEDDS